MNVRDFARMMLVVAIGLIAGPARAADKEVFPAGWLPLSRLDDKPAWADFRKIEDKVHLYLPPGVETVRGVFVCFVFHSGDPRELGRLWIPGLQSRCSPN